MPRYAAAIDTSGIPVKSLRPDTTGTAPSSPAEGQLWADSTNHQLKYWNGTAWVQCDNVVGGTASNVQDGDKGDITVASGIWTIDTGVITSAKILDGTVALGDLAFTPQIAGAAAGGDLAGTYPNPTIGTGAVTSAKIADGTITDTDVATANKDGVTGTPSMRTLGTGSQQAAAGNDTRLSDSRAPSGSAGGDLAGSTYPNPTIAAGAVTLAKMAANSVDSSKIVDSSITETDIAAANKDGAAGVYSLRTLGTGAAQALAGNTRLDTIAAPTGPLSLNSQRITNLTDPSGAQDAATKNYVDITAQGLDPKGSVHAATTANIANLAAGAPNTLDGVTLAANDRVLVKDQTTTNQNGIYTITTLGTGANGVWVRATDMDAWTEVPSAFTFVEQGTTQADTGWVCTADQGGTLGTTAITWVQFSGAAAIIDGNGLLKTGNTFDVRVDNTTIEITTDLLNVKAGGIGGTQLANGSVNLTTKVTGTLPLANGGTGGTDAATARASLIVPSIYNAVLGALTAGAYTTVNHNLNISGTPVVSVLEVSSGEEIILDWKKTSANAIQVKADLAFSASALQIAVTG